MKENSGVDPENEIMRLFCEKSMRNTTLWKKNNSSSDKQLTSSTVCKQRWVRKE